MGYGEGSLSRLWRIAQRRRRPHTRALGACHLDRSRHDLPSVGGGSFDQRSALPLVSGSGSKVGGPMRSLSPRTHPAERVRAAGTELGVPLRVSPNPPSVLSGCSVKKVPLEGN